MVDQTEDLARSAVFLPDIPSNIASLARVLPQRKLRVRQVRNYPQLKRNVPAIKEEKKKKEKKKNPNHLVYNLGVRGGSKRESKGIKS